MNECKGDVNSKYFEEKLLLEEGAFLLSKLQWLSLSITLQQNQDKLEENQHVILVDSSYLIKSSDTGGQNEDH